MNAASGVIDGSGLYEATEKEFQALRTYTNEKVDIKIYPLLNEHNRVAEKLHKLNNHVADAHIILYKRRSYKIFFTLIFTTGLLSNFFYFSI